MREVMYLLLTPSIKMFGTVKMMQAVSRVKRRLQIIASKRKQLLKTLHEVVALSLKNGSHT